MCCAMVTSDRGSLGRRFPGQAEKGSGVARVSRQGHEAGGWGFFQAPTLSFSVRKSGRVEKPKHAPSLQPAREPEVVPSPPAGEPCCREGVGREFIPNFNNIFSALAVALGRLPF